jgi:hypothetical protein
VKVEEEKVGKKTGKVECEKKKKRGGQKKGIRRGA